MNFDNLRQLLIDRAIQGKLVSQESSDETARQLLERIGKEKAALIKVGKIKGTPEASVIFRGTDGLPYEKVGNGKPVCIVEELPCEIPDNWEWARLCDICTKIVDGSHNPPKGEQKKTPYIMASAANINNNTLVDLSNLRYLSETAYKKENARTRAIKGDIFFTSVGSLGRSCIYEGGKNICFQRSVSVLTTLVYNHYLKFYFDCKYIQQTISSAAKGTAQQGFYLNQLKKLLVSIPPLEEQHRIVARLEKLLSDLAKAERAYKELTDLAARFREKTLQLAICGKLIPQLETEPAVKQIGKQPKDVPFDIPKKWKWTTLGEIGDWKAGATPSRSNSSYYKGGTIPWLKTGDLNDSVITSVPEFVTQKALVECSLRLNPAGSVLMAMYGATIGKLAILGIDCTTNQACCACIVNEALVNRFWLFYYLLSQRKKFVAAGIGGAQPNISKTKIVPYPVPLPPLEEQHRIVAKVKKILQQIDNLLDAVPSKK